MHPATVHAQLSGGRCAFLSESSSSSGVALGVRAIRASNLPIVGKSRESIAAENYPRVLAGLGADIDDSGSIASDGDQRSGQTAESSEKRRQLCDDENDDNVVKSEAYRISTYANNWKFSNIVTPKELAAAGFHYAGPGDRVQCAFCQGLLRNWEPGDRAMLLHAKHFTYCRFVQGHDVGNVPVPYLPLTAEHALVKDGAGSEEGGADATLGISRAVPTHPDLAVESRRLATFATWPESACSATPEAMAKAGFFYLGTESTVQCFHCNGTIGDWSNDADPWAKHARRYPNCAFVIQVKGRSYVAQEMSDTVEHRNTSHSASFAVDPREIRARVDTVKARILLQMDYPLDLIREVIQQRLASIGSDHETPEALLADVFATNDEKQLAARASVARGQPRRTALPLVVNGVPPPMQASRASTRTTGASNTLLVGGSPGPPLSVYSSEKATASTATMVEGSAANRDQRASLPSVDVRRTARVTSVNASEENHNIKMQLTCKICMDGVIGIVFTPCGHFVCCPSCAPAVTLCPICRVPIRGSVRCVL